MIEITIDNEKIKVEPGTTILQACEKLGIEIPIFCYHEKLSIAGNCRMCLVEVEGNNKPVASCSVPCSEGMKIRTTSSKVKKARKGVMEFLLINHPLDCPICDQGGECDLQDIAMGYGSDKSRFSYNKRAVKEKNFGPLIKTVMTRCIHCTRCIRFATEVAGTPELGATGMGENMEVTSYLDKTLTSEVSGNMIDICPVGALTSKPFSLTIRPWELNKTESIDVSDAICSNIRIDTRNNEVMRILPIVNEAINEEWISDKTRFSYDGLKFNRIDKPYIKINNKLVECSWDEVLNYIQKNINKIKKGNIAAAIGNQVDCESIILLKDLFKMLGSDNLLCSQNNASYQSIPRAAYTFNSGISGIEDSDFCLLIGTNPRKEAAILNTRIRKRYLQGNYEIFSIGQEAELSYPCKFLKDNPNILIDTINKKNLLSKKLSKAKKPMIIFGENIFVRKDSKQILYYIYKLCKIFSVVQKKNNEIIWNGLNCLNYAASRVGALDLKFFPKNNKFNLDKLYSLSMKKKLDMIYLLGVDQIDVKKLQNSFLIYQGHHGNFGAEYCDVVLPGSAYSEKNATYVNTEGKVQTTFKACNPPGLAKEDWKIIVSIGKKLKKSFDYYDIYDVRRRLIKENNKVFSSKKEKIKNEFVKFGSQGKLLNEEFNLPIQDFYLTDAITKSSKVMNQCSKELKGNCK
tara:strand:+ start:1388 stop:3448 length:2061 start_codon:yes stop_codon:yes gene_type:complete